MPRVLLGILFIAFTARMGSGQKRLAAVAFTYVAVVDADGLRPEQTVIARGDSIIAVGPTRGTTVPAGARVIDARGKYLIPGLWDMHVHLSFFGASRLPLFIMNGVTGVRDLGGVPDSIFRWRDQIRWGARLGPRIVAAGITLSGPASRSAPYVAGVSLPEEARAVVRENARQGADLIKVWSTIPAPAYNAALAQARTSSLTVTGHIPVDVGLVGALDRGQRGIEHTIGLPLAFSRDQATLTARLQEAVHGTEDVGAQIRAMLQADAAALASYDSTIARDMIARMATGGVWVCPTLTDTRAYTVMKDSMAGDQRLQYLSSQMGKEWTAEATAMTAADVASWKTLFSAALRMVGEMQRGGVRLIAGTDAGSTYDLPGFDLHNELALLVRAGLTPLQALTAATRSGAEAAGLGRRAGMVRVGYLADLVLLDANPLAAIGNTRKISGVAVLGRYLDRTALAQVRRTLLALR